MRHRRKINHLSRKSAHRKAMLANMASSLIIHKRIHTTLAKAKALRTYVEPLVTKAKLSVTTKSSKEQATHLRRVVFSYLQDKEAVTELFREISTKVADREGGYTRIIKLPNRLGDNAEMCMMEFVDYNENLLTDKASTEGKAKRKRRGGKKKSDESTVAVAEAPAAEVVDEVVAEVAAEEAIVEAEVVEELVEEKAEEVVAEIADAKDETKVEDSKEVKSEDETKKNKDSEESK